MQTIHATLQDIEIEGHSVELRIEVCDGGENSYIRIAPASSLDEYFCGPIAIDLLNGQVCVRVWTDPDDMDPSFTAYIPVREDK